MSDLLVKTSGQKLDKKQFTENSVKTLMLLHGWGMNSLVWEPIREALESQYHLLWIDLPGHGFNQHLEAESLDNIVHLIAKKTPDDTHVIGWSLGGMVAQALAQGIPSKIKSLTLVASTPRFSQSKNHDWPHAMSEEVLNRFADNLKQDPEKTIKGFIALQFIGVKNAKQAQNNLINHILNIRKNTQTSEHKKMSQDNDDNYNGGRQTGQKWGGVFDKLNRTVFLDDSIPLSEGKNNIPTNEALDVGLRILHETDLRSLESICPEHWIFAEYDRLIPKEVINDLKSLRADAQITLLEKAGHAPFITHTEIFIKHLRNFIDSQS